GLRVTILEPGPGLMHLMLDEEMQALVHEEVRRQGVAVRREKAIGFERNTSGSVHAVRTDKGEKVGCQLVVVAIGIVPNTTLAEQAGVRLGETGAIAVDAHMRTNAPNVWACGDCVEVERVIDRKHIHLSL